MLLALPLPELLSAFLFEVARFLLLIIPLLLGSKIFNEEYKIFAKLFLLALYPEVDTIHVVDSQLLPDPTLIAALVGGVTIVTFLIGAIVIAENRKEDSFLLEANRIYQSFLANKTSAPSQDEKNKIRTALSEDHSPNNFTRVAVYLSFAMLLTAVIAILFEAKTLGWSIWASSSSIAPGSIGLMLILFFNLILFCVLTAYCTFLHFSHKGVTRSNIALCPKCHPDRVNETSKELLFRLFESNKGNAGLAYALSLEYILDEELTEASEVLEAALEFYPNDIDLRFKQIVVGLSSINPGEEFSIQEALRIEASLVAIRTELTPANDTSAREVSDLLLGLYGEAGFERIYGPTTLNNKKRAAIQDILSENLNPQERVERLEALYELELELEGSKEQLLSIAFMLHELNLSKLETSILVRFRSAFLSLEKPSSEERVMAVIVENYCSEYFKIQKEYSATEVLLVASVGSSLASALDCGRSTAWYLIKSLEKLNCSSYKNLDAPPVFFYCKALIYKELGQHPESEFYFYAARLVVRDKHMSPFEKDPHKTRELVSVLIYLEEVRDIFHSARWETRQQDVFKKRKMCFSSILSQANFFA